MMNYPVYGEYDTVVSGGGLAGICCALALAERGSRVAIVEKRSALAWEITRAGRVFLPVGHEEAGGSRLTRLREELESYGRFREGAADPAYAELIWERWAAEAGIDILYHGLAVGIERDKNGGMTGVIAAAGDGYAVLRTSRAVETDDAGRLVPGTRKGKTATIAATRSYVLALAEAAQGNFLLGGRQAELRSLGRGKARLDLEVSHARGAEALRERLNVLIELERGVESDNRLAGAKLLYECDEAWVAPAFSLQSVQAGAVDRLAREGEPLLAGAWLTDAVGWGDEETELARRSELGEAAALRLVSV